MSFILTKINCIPLKIRSKADLKSKSQTIWQQIILFSRTANDMRVTQDLNSFREIIAHAHCSVDEKNFGCKSKNIFRVYHIRIIAQNKLVHTTWNRQIPQWSLSGMCACLPQHPWLFIFSSRGHDRQSSDQNFSSRGHDRQSSEQNNR